METIWDGDTGNITITATAAGSAVNLSTTTNRKVWAKSRTTGTVTELTVSSSDLPNGRVTANATSLGAGDYQCILRLTDANGNTVTYPSANFGPAVFRVKADMDD